MSNEIKKYFNNNKKFKYKYIPDTNYIKSVITSIFI